MIDDSATIAILLGVLALGIAIWDHVSDAVLLRFRRPVRARSTTTADAPTYFKNDQRTRLIAVQWKVENRLSYPLIAQFGFRGVDPSYVVSVKLSGDLIGGLSGTQYTLPPRQPVDLTFGAYVSENASGDFLPCIDLAPSGLRFSVFGTRFPLPSSQTNP
ncbi:MAG: hypothetical protein WA691_03330 [Thermoplasmata archaeon]